MKNYSAQNLNSQNSERNRFFFRKVANFIKSERFDGFFPNSNPNVDLFIKNYLVWIFDFFEIFKSS